MGIKLPAQGPRQKLNLDHPAIYCALNMVSGALLLAVATWCSFNYFQARDAAVDPAPLAITIEVRPLVRD